MNRSRLLLAAALLLSFAVFSPALRFSFVHDDVPQIVENPALRSWSDAPQAFTHHLWARGEQSVGNYYRPLFLLWLRLCYSLFELSSWGWHLAAILLHTLITLLAYLVSVRLLDAWNAGNDLLGGNKMTSALAALLFAIHPVHIESVAWISGSVDPLMAVFLLLSLLAFLKSEQARGAWRWLLLSLVCFCAALLTKETAIAFPVAMLLYVACRKKDDAGTRVMPAWAPVLCLFLLDVVYLFVRWHVLGALVYPRTPLSTGTILLTVPWALCWYLWHQLWPVGLSLFYDQRYVQQVFSWAFIVPLLLLAGLTIAVFFLRRRVAGLGFLTGWFFFFLLPCLNLRAYQITEIAHDRYLYLPSVAFCLLLAMLLQGLAHLRKELRLGMTLLLMLALGTGTLLQEAYYRDNYGLAVRGVTIAPKNTAALLLFARELTTRERADDALAAYARLTREVPSWWIAWYERGNAALRFQRWEEADVAFAHSAEIDPRQADQYYLRALAESRMGHSEQARVILQQGIANVGNVPILIQGMEELQESGMVAAKNH